MAPKMGRPKIENPKDQRLQVRVDKATIDALDKCAEVLNVNRSEVVRMGVELVRDKIEGK